MVKNVDETKCVNCRLCEYYCPDDVFRFKEGKVVIAYQEDCCNCWQCHKICPVDALMMNDAVPKQYDASTRWERHKELLSAM